MKTERFSLKGRRALVTGSSRGIGRAIAVVLAEAGADVAIHYAAQPEAAEETARQAAAFGGRTPLIKGDLGADGAAKSIHEQTIAALGGLDILVLNASVQIPKPWMEITREDFEKQTAVNYRSSLELLQLAVPGMIERQWGRILTIGSVQEKKPNLEMLIYSSLKNAQSGMALSLAKQLAPQGVTVNNLAPGVIETDRNRDRISAPEDNARVLSWIPAKVIGQPEDCAGAALLLCSDAGRYITGQSLFVDGGMSL
ncbi:MAG: SDR family NAD(P)-dependent oxidoreductase [Terrimicrobiaceae bacterium]